MLEEIKLHKVILSLVVLTYNENATISQLIKLVLKEAVK